MTRTEMQLRQHGRELRAMAPSANDRRSGLALRQTRTCARCGRYATFVLEDPAGGWYACAACGRYA